jgi:SSS family solute:Na+ symporter
MAALTADATPPDHHIAVIVFVVLLGIILVVALMASRWRRPKTSMNSLEEWGVGGRAFGNWVTWFLIGGASYTAYTMTAVPAYTWGYGAIGYFAVPVALLVTPIVFLVITRVWSVAHAHGFVTSAEFARARFGSRPLAFMVATTGIIATLPYIAVQLIALEAVFKVIGVNGDWPLLASLAILSIATFRSGLRGPALLSIVKDALLVWLVLSVLLVVAMSAGGWGAAFDAAERSFAARDGSLATDLLLSSQGVWTYLSLAVGTALSIFAYPYALTGILAAKDRNTIKRNAAALPIYVLFMGLMSMLGLFALAKGVTPVGFNPPKTIGDPDTIAPRVFDLLFPQWSAGIAFATFAMSALIPTAVMSISAANLFTRSIYVEYLRPRASSAEEARVSRWFSLVVKFGAAGVIIWLSPKFSAEFQIVGSMFMLQIVPTVFIGVMTGWFHRWALMLGLLTGLAASVLLAYQTPELSPATGQVMTQHFGGSAFPLAKLGLATNISIYIGLLALLVNLFVTVLLTAVLKLFRLSPNADFTRAEDYTADANDEGLDRLDHLLEGLPRQSGTHALR